MKTADFELVDRTLYLPAADTLVLADLHLGRDRSSAVELPVGERDDIHERIATHLELISPSHVVLAGDLLHSFDRVPTGVSESLRGVKDRIDDAGATVTVLQGNHDTMLSTLLSGPTQSEYRLSDDVIVAHGHRRPTVAAKRYVVGHEHPTILVEGARHPCALACADQFDGSEVIVVPAFTRLARGTLVNDLDAADSVSPLLTDLDRCRPIISTDDGPLEFPPLGTLRSLL
ncbi:metallophosphoesterase [Halanaeroarchaeum sulfurireducens]|uniref:Putative phosphoesterase, ICC n=1 Tax=Halanaeroarchaeum sulfurireducens TaxID=1604004 RepID=A0A0F7P818_9EURY|nr:metallophosphoesterase [Halanaeroarchaeum sulfurireducens]AKH97296.1 putative phosphoesterase, ICC [Halanaeroarchaeum sulfurireducens]ALG81698.1 putative phosphoesterase, ICC [Halanaeroarchaeum sulfurireducens]